MSTGPPDPDPAASNPSPGEDERSARRRVIYSREFLISVGTSSEACKRLPVGLDASKLSELGLVENGSRGRYVAPFIRFGDACSSGSGHTDINSNQLGMHPGNQCRDNWQRNDHDGLLGSGAFYTIPCYVGSLALNDRRSEYQRTRNTGGYQPTRQYKDPPVPQKNVGLVNTATFGSFENWNKDRVEEERRRRASFELVRKEEHQALQEKKKAPDSDKENRGEAIISLPQISAGKRDPPTKSDKQGGLNVSSLCKEDAIKTAPLLPTPITSPLNPIVFTNGLPQERHETQSFNTSHNSEAPPVSQKNVHLTNTVMFGSFENWNKDRAEEEPNRRASFELIRKEQHLALQEKKKAPDSDKENLGDGIISLLQNSARKRDPPTKSDKQGGLILSSLSKEDAIRTAPLVPTPTTSPLKPIVFTNGLSQKRLETQSFNTSHNSEIQQLHTEDKMESSVCALRCSGGILGSGHPGTLSTKKVPFSHSKCDPFHMRLVTGVECDKPTCSGSSQEGPIFDEEGVEIHLPEEDTLFSVDDYSYAQNTDHWQSAECARAEVLPPKDKAADLNYSFQSLDVSGSHFHDQIDPNNLYDLFGSRPCAELPKRNAGTMFLPIRPSDRNRQAPFDTPNAIHYGAYCPFPQDMKSMQGVRPAPGGPCAGLAAPHHIMQHITVPGSFPPQGFPRCAPLPQPVHHMPDYRTEMTAANSFQIHHFQPGYGETRMMMSGPPGPDVGVNQAEGHLTS